MLKLTEHQKKILKKELPYKGTSRYFTGTLKKDTTFTGNAPMHFMQGKRVNVAKGTSIILSETNGSMGKSIVAYLPNGDKVSDWDLKVLLSYKKEHLADWEKPKKKPKIKY